MVARRSTTDGCLLSSPLTTPTSMEPSMAALPNLRFKCATLLLAHGIQQQLAVLAQLAADSVASPPSPTVLALYCPMRSPSLLPTALWKSSPNPCSSLHVYLSSVWI